MSEWVMMPKEHWVNMLSVIRNLLGYDSNEATFVSSSFISRLNDVRLSTANITTLSMDSVSELKEHSVTLYSEVVSAEFPNVTDVKIRAFKKCKKLESVKLPKATNLGWSSFSSCERLQFLDLPCVTYIDEYCFHTCTALETVILRSETVCSITSTTFKDSAIASGSGYVYVPAALVDSYKADTNWSEYASQIRAIEDYPEICG